MNAVLLTAIGTGGMALGAVLSALVNRLIPPPEARHERKCARLKTELQRKCPHGELVFPGDQVGWQSWFTTTHGTLKWWCERCGKTASDSSQVERTMQSQMGQVAEAISEPASRQRWLKMYWGSVDRCEKILGRLQRAGCELKAEL